MYIETVADYMHYYDRQMQNVNNHKLPSIHMHLLIHHLSNFESGESCLIVTTFSFQSNSVV